MVTDAVKIMKDMMEAANSQNYEKLTALFTDDYVYEDLPLEATSRGKKELIVSISRVHASVPDHKWELKSSFSDGHRIATEWLWSGTPTHDIDPERPATGKHVSFRGVSITELHNGKISRNTDYYDMVTVQQQLGA